MSDNMRTFAANKPQRGNEYKMLSVIIADDHHLVAEGIAKLLHESRVAKVVAIAHDITETKEKIRSIQPQMLLLDVAMPDGDGIDAIKMFRESCPTMEIDTLSGLKMWLYLVKNQSAYTLALSPTDCREWGITEKSYHSGVAKLIELGYNLRQEDE